MVYLSCIFFVAVRGSVANNFAFVQKHVLDSQDMDICENLNEKFPYEHILEINCKASKHAECVCRALLVDEEIQPHLTQTTLTSNHNILTLKVLSADLRTLRVKLNSFYESIILCIKTIEAFDNIE